MKEQRSSPAHARAEAVSGQQIERARDRREFGRYVDSRLRELGLGKYKMDCKKGDTVNVGFFNSKSGDFTYHDCLVVSPPVPDCDQTLVIQIEFHGAFLGSCSWNGEEWIFSPGHQYC